MDDSGPGAPPPPGEEPSEGRLPARGLGDILSAAFDIYRSNASQLLLIVAVVVVPLSILDFLLSHFAFAPHKKSERIQNQVVRVTETRSFWIFILAALVATAISFIISALLQAAILRAATQATIGDELDVDRSYRWGLRRFGSVLLVSILVGLAVGIGFVLFIIPGIIFLVMFAVAVPVVVVENRRGTEAMRRSWELVRGHFWHVLGVIVVAAIITGLVQAVFNAIGGSNAVLELILGTIGQIIVAPFSALVAILLYLDVRARVESLTPSQLRTELGPA
jgi:hypothetical protein